MRLSESDPFTQTVAVPVVLEPGRVVATLGTTFFRRVLNHAQCDMLAAALTSAAAAASVHLNEESGMANEALPGTAPCAARAGSQQKGKARR